MKKIMLLSGLLVLSACGGKGPVYKADQDVTVYGIVHKQYVGVLDVKTNAKGKLTDVVFDETFLPHNWAGVTINSTNKLEDFQDTLDLFDHVTFSAFTRALAPDADITTANPSPVYMAKYVRVNGTKFTLDQDVIAALENYAHPKGTLSAPLVTDFAAFDFYKDATGKALSKNTGGYLTDDNYLKTYVANMKAGTNMGILADDAATEVLKDDAGKLVHVYESGFKTEGHYWAAGTSGLGWQKNVDNVADFIKKHGFNFTTNGKDADGYWKVTIDGKDISTGSSLADFAEYGALAMKAHEIIKLDAE